MKFIKNLIHCKINSFIYQLCWFGMAITFSQNCLAQEAEIVADSIIVQQSSQEMSPIHKIAFKRAWHSAVLPTWGQFENKQAWKAAVFVPSIAGGLFIGINALPNYRKYNNAMKSRSAGNTNDAFFGVLNDYELSNQVQKFRRQKNLGFAMATTVYAIQMMDAYVFSVINQKAENHSPAKAAFLSAMIPGLGQIYNKKHWKLPIVYGALGAAGYFIVDNTRNHNAFKEAYINYEVEGFTPKAIATGFTRDGLLNGRKIYQRNLEVAYIVAGVLYVANILDAVVDAHLFDFDVSDDLGISAFPNVGYQQYGATLSFNF